jgi:pimeloyl-ACP methyl ester carboxylesterase
LNHFCIRRARAIARIAFGRRLCPTGATALALLLAACATPAEHYRQRATEAGFAELGIQGAGFRHVGYAADLGAHADTLRVYVEHDGTPWRDRAVVERDPTPRSPLALELMARDSGPRLLLGRPCHFEAVADPRCDPLLWTHERYSPAVVASMVEALRRVVAEYGYRRVVLIGYSGGGTVAWLMAARVPEAVAVITVAANLDTGAWTRLHGYSPLEGSLDPASETPLPANVAQLHFAGARDRNVPPAVVESFAARHPGARVVVIDDFDHRCCWAERWRQLLDQAAVRDPQRGTRASVRRTGRCVGVRARRAVAAG